MADGRITGRLIRHNFFNHKGKDTGVLYLTLVKTRGTYRSSTGETKRAASDFLTFEQYIDGSQAATNKMNLLKRLANDSTLVELSYNLKSSTYTDNNGETVYKEYKQLQSFEILESKQAVRDRLNKQSNQSNPSQEIENEDEEVEFTAFDPDEAGSFIQNEVSEHLKKSTPKTTEDGKYGNPFKTDEE